MNNPFPLYMTPCERYVLRNAPINEHPTLPCPKTFNHQHQFAGDSGKCWLCNYDKWNPTR